MNEVLIVQSDPATLKTLADHFLKRGDIVWSAESYEQAVSLLKGKRPVLALVDLHLPGRQVVDLLALLRKKHPDVRVIATNRFPDLRHEFIAKEQGVHVFLREPFTSTWIERAITRLEETHPSDGVTGGTPELPKVRIPMRLKIILPYAALAVLFALAAAYMVSRFVMDTIDQRFTNQLVDAGKLSADWMVQEEDNLLRTLRQVANTQGMVEAVHTDDSDELRDLTLPTMLNQAEDALEILDLSGTSLLSLRKLEGDNRYSVSRGSLDFAELEETQWVLQNRLDQGRDKYASLVVVDGVTYLFISGPIRASDNAVVGAVMVGRMVDHLAAMNRQDTLAHVTFYNLDGSILASTLLIDQEIQPLDSETIQNVLTTQDTSSSLRTFPIASDETTAVDIRNFTIASASYAELLAPWEARGGEDLGVVGIALAENKLLQPSLMTRVQAFFIVLVGLLAVIGVGMFVGSQVTHPLRQVVRATTKIAGGNLDVRVPSTGNDEVAVLASAFNYMVSGLQEGSIYRDLLGRTVSPEVREAMRTSFASGELRLEGQNTVATVMMSDIRGFTSLSENEEPTRVLTWLNEYFSEIVPVVTSYGGVVDKFEGDAMLAFFGILPAPLSPEESAYNACQAGVELLSVISKINARRAGRGEVPLVTGITINTGKLTAGGLGTADRLNYTIIGDTVNTTQRMQDLTRKFTGSSVVINETTLSALQGRRGDFDFEPLGEHAFPGKSEQLWLYRIIPNGRLKMKEPS